MLINCVIWNSNNAEKSEHSNYTKLHKTKQKEPALKLHKKSPFFNYTKRACS